jgi:hypothetical protein
VYLVDTNVISEARKGEKAHPGVRAFLHSAARGDQALFLSVVTIGELRRGVELIRHRGDQPQARLLERWLQGLLCAYADRILDFDAEAAQVWGRLRVPHAENELDKQIAATALVHDLTVVSCNAGHFAGIGVPTLNPFVKIMT